MDMADVPDVIESPHKRRFSVQEKLYEGDLTDLYACSYSNGASDKTALLKITRERKDNDLVENEASILGVIYPPRAREEKFYRYFPKVIDSFLLTQDRTNRRVTVLPRFEGYLSFEEIIRAYPKGIDFRDMVWMFKRLLVGIGFAHLQGVVHGAVVPSHVLVHPTEHGAKIIDWSYALNFAPPPKTKDPDPVVDPKANPAVARSVWDRVHDLNLYDTDPTGSAPAPKGKPGDPSKQHIKAISVAYDKFYAPEVFKKQSPTPATDIFMAGKCAIALLGGDVENNTMPDEVPKQIQAFLSGAVLASPRKRPQDAWDLHEAFDNLLRRLVGPPKYRPFHMPTDDKKGGS